MLSIEEVENTIIELENGNTTFDSCIKLASLYVVRDHYKPNFAETQTEKLVKSELHDILPSYVNYCDVKRNYQLGNLSKEAVVTSMKSVGKEIYEFLQTLYSSTDTAEEREILVNSIKSLNIY